MGDALLRLLDGADFDSVLNEFSLTKYELLSMLRKELLTYKKNYNFEQREMLKSVYLSSYSMLDLNGQSVAYVSDTHYASKYENDMYFSIVLDFCRKQKISYLFHGGDIGDGLVKASSKYRTPQKQIAHIVDLYPEDDFILQCILGGNHDCKYLKHELDLLKILVSEKKNILPLGYFQSYFTVYGYPISFEHHSNISFSHRLVNTSFAITGHAHKSRFDDNFIKLPALSDDIELNNGVESILGFVVMDTVSYGAYFDLIFSRYSFSNLAPIKEESYTYQFSKRF